MLRPHNKRGGVMTFKQSLSALALGTIVFLSPVAGPAGADPSKGATESVSSTPSRSTRAVGMTGHFRWQVVLQCSQGKCTRLGPVVGADNWYNVIHNVSCFVRVA